MVIVKVVEEHGIPIDVAAGTSMRSAIAISSADVLIHPDLADFAWIEFYRATEIAARGEEAARSKLGEIEQLLAERRRSSRTARSPGRAVLACSHAPPGAARQEDSRSCTCTSFRRARRAPSPWRRSS